MDGINGANGQAAGSDADAGKLWDDVVAYARSVLQKLPDYVRGCQPLCEQLKQATEAQDFSRAAQVVEQMVSLARWADEPASA